MDAELQLKLQRFLPIRVVVRINNEEIEGKIEHSFSMDWSKNLVNIFWSGKAYSILGEHELNGPDWASKNVNEFNPNEFVIDPLGEDSPIEIDWERWLLATSKFSKRNADFKVKPHGVRQLESEAAKKGGAG